MILAGRRREAEPLGSTILFVPVTVPLPQVAAGWAEDCDTIILRHCPICKRDSIVGHGRRRKQAHDEHHDWIGIRRGRCAGCGKTFTFLPVLSLPIYALQLASAVPSLVAARCGALLVGRGGAEVQSTGSIARCFHDPPLVERCGRLSKRPSFSPPDDGTGGSEARVYGFASGRSGVLILANSGSGTPPAVAFVRKIPSPTILAWECQ